MRTLLCRAHRDENQTPTHGGASERSKARNEALNAKALLRGRVRVSVYHLPLPLSLFSSLSPPRHRPSVIERRTRWACPSWRPRCTFAC